MLLTIPKTKNFSLKGIILNTNIYSTKSQNDLAIEHVHNTLMVDMFYYVCFPFILTFCHSTFIPSAFKFKLF